MFGQKVEILRYRSKQHLTGKKLKVLIIKHINEHLILHGLSLNGAAHLILTQSPTFWLAISDSR